jgi:hypothetical protein
MSQAFCSLRKPASHTTANLFTTRGFHGVPGFPVTLHSPTPACAAFSKESRMKSANAPKLSRKPG